MEVNFSGVGERLEYLLSLHKMKQSDVIHATGISKNAMSNYVSGNRIPDNTSLYKLAKFFKVSMEWLLTGEDVKCKPVNNLTDKEMELVLFYRSITDEDREEIDILLNLKVDRMIKKRNEVLKNETNEEAAAYDANSCQKRIPLLGRVAAGIPIWAESEYMDLVPVPSNNTRIDYALVVRGDSMEPEIHDGAILFVKKQSTLDNGDIGIILIDDSATCKKFYKYDDRIELHSLNKKYKPIIIREDDQVTITILGKAFKVSESSNGSSYIINPKLA